MRHELLRKMSLFLTVALTAVDVVYAVPVNGSYRRMNGVEYARAHRRVVKVAGPTAPLLAVPLVITDFLLLSKMRGERGFGLVISSLICLFANAGITFGVNVPVNNQFSRTSDDTSPEHWESLRDRWALAHNLRISAQITGLVFLLTGLAKSDGTTMERN